MYAASNLISIYQILISIYQISVRILDT